MRRTRWRSGCTTPPSAGRHPIFSADSFFSNALPKVFPGVLDLPLLVLFAPQFLLLGVLAFWMIRVRLTSWYARDAPAEA